MKPTRFAFSTLAALALISAAANFASAKSDSDRYLPLPSAPSVGKLMAGPVSDSSMGVLASPHTPVQHLIDQARINKKN